ncbi:MAG: 23S rRNA (uracil(1939)-C(5))-methyltransferase RlmD, partial [Eubacteriales bacterium]
VLAKVIKVLKSYAVAIPEAILQPSADRSAGGCAVAGQCGGCVFQHITYEAECRFKAQTIDAAFERIAKLPIRLSAFHAARSENAYRNKAVYPVGTDKNGLPVSGFYAPVSHRIVRHESCAIGQPLFPSVRDAVLAFAVQKNISLYDEQTRKGILRGIYLRAAVSGEIILTLILSAEHLGSQDCERDFCRYIKERFAQICSIVINVNTKSSNAVLGDKWRVLDGDGYLYDELCGKRFRVSPAAFWQVNHAQAEVLYGIAARFAALLPGEKLLDLYCGTGSVGLCIAGADTRLTGVEIVPEAVEDAAFNALLNGMEAQFLCLDAAYALEDPRLLALAPDVITIDPPRKGCGVDSARKIAALGAKRIVYISCDPATLARDLAAFADCGYLPLKAEGVDMFPRTAHVECVVLMSRIEKEG